MLFSLIIPTYNRADFILKTINSLLQQPYDRFEIIVVDDGSTDNTESVVSSIKHPKVSYYKKPNAERAAARNFGARLAKGDYINFFDSDDLAYPNHCAEAAQAVTRLNHPEVFHLGYDIKDDTGKLLNERKEWASTINDALINGNHLSCNGVFLRRDIALRFPFNETRALSASEDYELWLRLASRFPIHCVSVVTTTVVNHDSRSVLNINLEKFLQRMTLLESGVLNDEAFVNQYGPQINTFRAYNQLYIALHLAIANKPMLKCLSYLMSAIRLQPSILFTRRFLGAVKNLML